MVPESPEFILGQPASLSCTSDLRGAAIEWSSGPEDGVNPASVRGDDGSLNFTTVCEDLHNRVYVCSVTTPYGSLEEEYNISVKGEVVSP